MLVEPLDTAPYPSGLHAQPDPAPGTVAAVAKDAMKTEVSRGEAVRSRAAGLMGSCGVLLTLTVGLGDSALRDAAAFGRVGQPLAVSLGLLGVACLLVSGLLAALVFAPSRDALRSPMHALRAFVEVQFRTADPDTLAEDAKLRLHEARTANVLRGQRLLYATLAFAVALGCLAAEAGIVGMHRL